MRNDSQILLCLCTNRAVSLFIFGTKHLPKVFHFANGDWKIHTTEMMKAHDKLSLADQKLFIFDLKKLEWEPFICTYARGARTYLLREPLTNIPEASRRYRQLKYLHYTTMTIFFLVFVYYTISLLNYLIGFIFWTINLLFTCILHNCARILHWEIRTLGYKTIKLYVCHDHLCVLLPPYI